MTQNTETQSNTALERRATLHSHISDAEKLLFAIEAGKSPDEELVTLLNHADSYGNLDDRIVADEVGGLAVAEHITKTDELPHLLGEQQIDGLAIAFHEIEQARGEETLSYIVNRIETAEQLEDTLPEEFVFTQEVIEQQFADVQEMLESYNIESLSEYLACSEPVCKQALDEVIRLVGVEAFGANSFFREGEHEEQLETIAEQLIDKRCFLPVSEQVDYLESIVGLEMFCPRTEYVAETAQAFPELIPAIHAMLFDKKAYAHLVRNIESLQLNPKDIVKHMYEEGQPGQVIDNISFLADSVDTKDLQERLYQSGLADRIAYNLDIFNTYDQHRLYETLSNDDKIYIVVNNLNQFPDIDKKLIIDKCVDGNASYLLQERSLMNAIPPEAMEIILRDQHEYAIILAYPELFPDVDMSELVELSFSEKRGYTLLEGMRTGKYLLDKELIYQKILEHEEPFLLFAFPEYFSPEQMSSQVIQAIKGGSSHLVLKEIDSISGYTRDDIIRLAIEHDQGYQLFFDDEHLEGVPMENIVKIYLDSGKYSQLITNEKQIVPHLKDKGESILSAFTEALQTSDELSEKDFSVINSYLFENLEPGKYPDALKLANRYMGFEGATFAGYKIVQALQQGVEVPPEALGLGVTKGGTKGLEQFGNVCRAISQELMDSQVSDETLQKVLNSELYAGIMQKLYRVDIAEFGENEEFSAQNVLKRHHEASAEGNIAPLPAEYTVHQTEISTLEERSVGLTQDALERYKLLRTDILSAVSSLSEAHPFAQQLEKIGSKMIAESSKLSQDAAELEEANDTTREAVFKLRNIREKQEALSRLLEDAREGKYVGKDFVLRSPEDMSHVFGQLEKFDSLQSDLRQIIFAWALRKNPVLLEELKSLGENPDVDELGTVRSFVEQIVNQETFGNYFTDKKLATRFRKLSSVKSIDEALVRHQQDSSAGKTSPFTLTPTRSAAMELSGHVGDACWAGKYESIAEEFPNITSVIMKRGEKGSSTERLVGSALLIETTDDAGNGVLLLRGINPTENFVNKVRIEEFYQTMTNYCRDIAAKRGLTPAVVIDTMSGASGTNRPVVHEYQERMKEKMKQVIVDATSSTFNGYDVSNKSYAL